MSQTDGTPSPQITPPPVHQHGPNKGLIFAGGAVLLALIICAFALGSALGSGKLVVEDNGPVTNDDVDLPDGKGDGSDTETPAPDSEDDDEATSTEEILAVDWLEADEQTEVPVSYSLTGLLSAWGGDSFYRSLPQFRSHELGIVKGGEYDGYSVVDTTLTEEGMGTSYSHYFTLRQEANKSSQDILLKNYKLTLSAGLDSLNTDYFEKSTNKAGDSISDFFGSYFKGRVSTAELDAFADLEPTISAKSGPEDTYAFRSIGDQVNYPGLDPHGALFQPGIDQYESYPVVGTLNNGLEVRRHDSETFFTIIDPGFVVWYDGTVSFWDSTKSLTQVPDVTINGQKVTKTYMKGRMGGCGFQAPVNVVDKSVVGALKEVGYSNSNKNDKIYAPVSYDTEYFAPWFHMWQRTAEDGDTIEDFAATTPFFYFTDDFGRLLQFSSTEVVPAGECGKPVIYLYPEKTTSLNVQLAPQGGFTITEPDYGNGWNVIAKPNGELKNKADGKTYPYLFWEGLGDIYSEPTLYDVVAQADVPSYLTSTLAKLGLNEKETADFMEFWVPLMTEAPYYKIGWHGTNVMDQIAPMTISQTPDTIIRILMDYEELEAPIDAQPPRLIPPPEREGFTVIEWGGVLRHY